MRLPLDREKYFPNLTPDNYRVSSDESEDYNCIAHAYGTAEVCYWPPVEGVGEGYSWPQDLPVEETPEAFVAFFARGGYAECETLNLEEGYEKVALYADRDVITHAAIQLPTGHWSSKLGVKWEDIDHDTPQGVESIDYGQIARILRRPRAS